MRFPTVVSLSARIYSMTFPAKDFNGAMYHIINKIAIFAAQNNELNMAKNTMGTKLPRKLEEKMAVVGEQIRLARLRRNLSVAQVAERATCSPLTVGRIERGVPTVAMGIYARVLYALQLDDDLLLIAKEDVLGRTLQDLNLKHRQRASKKEYPPLTMPH